MALGCSSGLAPVTPPPLLGRSPGQALGTSLKAVVTRRTSAPAVHTLCSAGLCGSDAAGFRF